MLSPCRHRHRLPVVPSRRWTLDQRRLDYNRHCTSVHFSQTTSAFPWNDFSGRAKHWHAGRSANEVAGASGRQFANPQWVKTRSNCVCNKPHSRASLGNLLQKYPATGWLGCSPPACTTVHTSPSPIAAKRKVLCQVHFPKYITESEEKRRNSLLNSGCCKMF